MCLNSDLKKYLPLSLSGGTILQPGGIILPPGSRIVPPLRERGRDFFRSEFRHTSLGNILLLFSESNYILCFLIFEKKKSHKFKDLVKSGGTIVLLHGTNIPPVE